MCGLAGYSGAFDESLLRRMAQAIRHRGPDDEGVEVLAGEGVGLAHRRLSIIDLSPAGHQPMWDAADRAAIVFNGEIYNYRELRAELVSQGFAFKGRSDTEVLLNLYLRDGEAMLPKLNGIFAFAIWNSQTRSLFLARDGQGVKPLYYSESPRGVLFASELKALLNDPGLDRTIDPLAVHCHLNLLWAPSPLTMLRGVRKLEPGHALSVKDGRVVRRWCHYDLPYAQPIERLSPGEAVEAVRAAVAEAVRRQMVADVPVGAFLSGGLDSSAVVAFARRHLQDRRLQCFTIGFGEEAGRKEDFGLDYGYARRVAAHLDVDLHVVHAGPELAGQLEDLLWHLDEPQADFAPLNALMICRLARSRGIKVLLSGAGGDDIFTGYRRHFALGQEKWWSGLPVPARAALKRLAGALPPSTGLGRRIGKAFQYADMDGTRRLASYFLWPDRSLQSSLYGPYMQESLGIRDPLEPLLETLGRIPADTHPLNKMLYLEGKHFLPDHNLNYTDKVSMAEGVEVRVPLLDPDLIALAARLPVGYKQRGAVGKWVFKKAMEPDLPRDVIYRPKVGFGAPLRSWLRHELRPLVEDTLSPASLRRRGLFDDAKVSRMLSDWRAGRVDGAYTVFSIVCIELWCKLFIDGRTSSRGGGETSLAALSGKPA